MARRQKYQFANQGGGGDNAANDNLSSALSHSACKTTTAVKFVPRSYFDQTQGAKILQKLAQEDASGLSP